MATATTERALLLVGHGTISDPSDVPEFLLRIRRGRPPSAELVQEIRRRYDYIGGSPLLRVTESLAHALEGELGLPVRVAMRFWKPLIEEVVRELIEERVHELCILPVAPFSVHIYVAAVSDALAEMASRADGAASPPIISAVPAYGEDASLVSAHAMRIAPFLKSRVPETTALVFSAHSLPVCAIAAGDPYQRDFEASARAIARSLGWPATIAYQSQGDGGGAWLGPTVADVLADALQSGKRDVVIAPIGFLADHVETLFDLDIEAKGVADSLGVGFTRVPALNDSPSLVRSLSEIARRAFGTNR